MYLNNILKKLSNLLTITIIAFTATTTTYADITIFNGGGYVIRKACTVETSMCDAISLPKGQSHKIPSNRIPDEGVRISVDVLCAIFLLFPFADAEGTTTTYLYDGDTLNLSGACIFWGEGIGFTKPNSGNISMEWEMKL